MEIKIRTAIEIKVLLLIKKGEDHDDSSNSIECDQCANYEANLQKLENEIRQHIRVQQQLKLYNDSLEQKVEDAKKERKDYDKKY